MPRTFFAIRQRLNAADQQQIMDQSIMLFATAAARTAAIPTPTTGMHTWRSDSGAANKTEYWNGSAWIPISLTSPIISTPGVANYAPTASAPAIPAGTNPLNFGAWGTIGTVPAGMTHFCGVNNAFGSGNFVQELSLNGGTTVLARFPVGSSATSRMVRMTPRSVTAGATISSRLMSLANSGSSVSGSIGAIIFANATPSIVTTVPETVVTVTDNIFTAAGVVSLGVAIPAARLVGFVDAQNLVTAVGVGATMHCTSDTTSCTYGGLAAIPAGTVSVTISSGGGFGNFATAVVVTPA
jgi:hypothetical protein